MKAERKALFITLIFVNLFTVITLIVFAPYEIYIYNCNDFEFSFSDLFGTPLIAGGVYFIFITLLGLVLPIKLSKILVTLEFALTFCSYLQTMFFNGRMEALLGQEVSWDIATVITNLLLWIVAIVIVFIITIKWKEKADNGFRFVSFAVTVMQLVALVFLLLTTDVLVSNGNQKGYPSVEGMLSLSSEKNVVVFLLDYFDGRTMDAVLQEYPDILYELDGFTYYPNATSVHSRTFPSVTYLLTGNMCYFDTEYREYVNNAHKEGKLIPTLQQNNIDMGVYTYEQYVGECISAFISNWSYGKINVNPIKLEKYLLKMTLYRGMPYLLKPQFEYSIGSINNNVKESIQVTDKPYENANDEWVKSEFEKGLYIDETTDKNGTFRFFHLASCHNNLSQPVEPAVYSLEIVNDYLRQMKRLGIYEDATVLIITDHGYSGGGETLDMPHETAVPIFFVKPSGSAGVEIKISEAPVSHTDFIPTVLDGFGLEYADIGQPVYNINEAEGRERLYYYSALHSDQEGEIELREYKICGDARNASNYVFTGNVWDILFSENRVAK